MGRHVVRRVPGPGWLPGTPVRRQPGWDEHAAFMDGLAGEGLVAFGGPAGEQGAAVLAVDAPDELAIRARLAADPWERSRILRTVDVEPWTVWLGGEARIDAERPLQLVREGAGPRWDPALGRRGQAGWDEHAAFMDGLVQSGAIVLGGPVGARHALLVLQAGDVAAAESLLEGDPWLDGTLCVERAEPWTLWLRPAGAQPAAGVSSTFVQPDARRSNAS